MTVINRRYDLA